MPAVRRAPLITVAICTWNRAPLLRQTLASLVAVRPPSRGWELLVVDNGSTDGTRQVIAEFASTLPIREVREARRGLSHARNAAITNAIGEFIVWTDDDVLVEPGWLRAYEAAFARRPEAAVFGGTIRPWFDGAPPTWLLQVIDRVPTAYAICDPGDVESPLRLGERLPFGANFAVRRDVQRQFPYDPRFGRKGKGGALGEEHVVLRSILSSGTSGWWVPEAVVNHFIGRERQTVGYLRRYFRLSGKTYALNHSLEGKMLLGRPFWLWRRAAEFEARYWFARLRGEPQEWIKMLIMSAEHAGMLRLCSLFRREE